MRKDLAAATAMRAQEIAHVLDDAEHRHLDLGEHVEALAGVEERDVLRRRDDDGAGERYLLRHRQLRVAGTGRHVGDHDVELAPLDLAPPPLPEATATIAPTPGTAPRAVRTPAAAAGCGAARARVGACAVSTAVTESTPGKASTAFSAALRSGSRRGPRSLSTSIAKATL